MASDAALQAAAHAINDGDAETFINLLEQIELDSDSSDDEDDGYVQSFVKWTRMTTWLKNLLHPMLDMITMMMRMTYFVHLVVQAVAQCDYFLIY